MNILFFLTPKIDVIYLQDNFTIRQALEKMEYHRYTSIPVLNKKGEYVGTLTEGDILWALKGMGTYDLRTAEQICIMDIPRKANYKSVRADTDIQDLLQAAATQNFVPVIDDKNSFIGIVTRTAILQYCIDRMPREPKRTPRSSYTSYMEKVKTG